MPKKRKCAEKRLQNGKIFVKITPKGLIVGCSQAVRHRILTPLLGGSNPSTPAINTPRRFGARYLYYNESVEGFEGRSRFSRGKRFATINNDNKKVGGQRTPLIMEERGASLKTQIPPPQPEKTTGFDLSFFQRNSPSASEIWLRQV